MKKRIRFIVGGLLIVGLLGYLVVSGFNQNTMVYYKTVSEVKAEAEDLYGKGVRLGGIVVEGSLKQTSKTLDYSFTIADEGGEIQVRYHGVLPDIFKEGNEVLVEGKVHLENSESGVPYFEARHVFTKCPSKYEGEVYEDRKVGN